MSIYRSEEISHKFMRIAKDQAVEVLSELGKMKETLQFIDLNKKNPESYKNFNPLIKRCDELERKINNFENLTIKYNIPFTPFTTYNEFDIALSKDIDTTRNSNMQYFDYIENLITEDEKKINELISSTTHINDTLSSLIERKNVYEVCLKLTENNQIKENANNNEDFNIMNNINNNNENNNPSAYLANIQSLQNSFGLDQSYTHSSMSVIAGVLRTEDLIKMKRMLFRVSRGRALLADFNFPDFDRYVLNDNEDITYIEEHRKLNEKTKNIDPQVQGYHSSINALCDRNMVGNKSIFVIFFPNSSEDNILYGKVLKVCDIFSASRYTIPKAEALSIKIKDISKEINSNINISREINYSLIRFILDRGGNSITPSQYELYKIFISKEKLIYTTLSKCILRDHFIDAEVYVHKNKFPIVMETLNRLYSNQDSKSIPVFEDILVQDKKVLPTLIKTNEFTWIFQQIVNTYGVPRYGEINPALFNIITFPFLFGIMFGDIGHGALLLIFSSYLIIKSEEIRKSDNKILKLFLKVRYLFLFMGISAFYCGWIYNDFFSMPLGIFGTCYENVLDLDKLTGYAVKKEDCVYPFGLDPKWYSASNELAFMNSLKMKVSVIFGVLQMLGGIFLKGLNSLYFNSYLDFFLEFIPQIIFMSLIFGYMNVMIIIKWCINWSERTTSPPSIITSLLNMFLKGGSVDGEPLYGDSEGEDQESVHLYLFIIAIICVPIMLFPKPIILYCRHNKQEKMMINEEHNEDKDEVSI